MESGPLSVFLLSVYVIYLTKLNILKTFSQRDF